MLFESCMICEDEDSDEWWKCETCVFFCHEKCMKKWAKESQSCPLCRSKIHSKLAYKKEEIFLLLFVISVCNTPCSAEINSLN